MGFKWDIGKCCDCGKFEKVYHREWTRASRPKCIACGGRLDPSEQATKEHAKFADVRKESRAAHKKKTRGVAE